jgi:hypothetical protein
VTLEGTVPERQMKYAIEDVVDRCWGVQDVENYIRVQPPRHGGQQLQGFGAESETTGGATAQAGGKATTTGGEKGKSNEEQSR